ncbi:MAG: ROK family transcriptional regulator [Lachnospiraceae bacterium]|nr:ROK family transcriptional regulator [Lachnospiraceae bacterium]
MSTEKIGVNEIKTKNRQIIYNYIRKQGSVSKQEIVVEMQLSLPTVTTNLDFLKKQGLIDTSGKIKNTGGRNATAFTYVKNARMAIGVDITANHITAVAVNLSGDIVSMERRRSNFDLEDDAYLREIGEVVECVKKDADIMDENLLGVGISVQSLVSDDGSEITYGMALNFAKKKREEIAAYVPYRNRLIHDSYAAGYRETWTNREFQNAFYISLSNSVGGSVIIDDAIYEGNTHKGGEVGHMTVVPEGGELCYCGRRGCFDTVCRAGRLTGYTDGSVEEFFRLLEEEDETAKRLWDEYLDHLTMAIHNVRMLFDGMVILGGYVGAYAGRYMDDICRRVDERNPFGDRAKDYLVECRYKVEASAAGAALFYIDEFLDKI